MLCQFEIVRYEDFTFCAKFEIMRIIKLNQRLLLINIVHGRYALKEKHVS